MSEKVKVYEIDIDELLPDPTNANKGSLRGQKMIDDSIAKTGLHRGVAVDANGYVVAGNKTQQAAIDAGFKKALVVETDGDTLVVTKRRDFNLLSDDPNNIARQAAYYDNRSSEISLTWDAEVLLSDLNSGLDLSNIFDQSELDALLDGLIEKEPMQPAEAQVDKAAELQKQWGTSLGQIWQLGKHRLACGDCTDKATVERLMRGEKADLYITDPPYAVAYADKNAYLNAVGKGNSIQTPIENDHLDVDEAKALWLAAFKNAHEFTSNQASFYVTMPQGGDQMMMMMMMCEAEWIPRHELIWVKNNHVLGRADYAYKHEPILYGWKRKGTHKYYGGFQTSIFEIDKPQKSDLHPTTKPVELFAKLIENNSQTNDIILDTFAGSGTTCLACEQLGRQARLIELDAGYCAVILQRYKDSTNVEPVLIES